MKSAAPQAPRSTLHPAKTRAKGREASAAPATSPGAGAFSRVLAKAVAAKGREASVASARTAVRVPGAEPAVRNGKADAARAKTTGRDSARAAGRRRDDEASGVERVGAEQPLGRAAAAALPTVAAAQPSAARPTGAAAPATRTEPRVQVVDLRKKPASAAATTAERSAAKSPVDKSDASAPATKPFADRLAAPEAQARAAAPARPTPLERIREMTGSDLVRTAGIVVRDGGGEIRLTLKPESLGSVRIRLSLEDGKVEGRIVVDTQEARQAFEAGIDSLARALQADGFQTGSLQVSVSGGNANDSRQAAGLLGDTIRGARLRASDEALQAAVPPAGWTGGEDGLVNVFA